MNTTREYASATPIEGNLLRLGERREVAIYLREGVAWVAEFNNGRATLHSVSEWHSSGSGRALVHAQRRGEVEIISPLPEAVVQRIEALHQRMARPVIGPAVRRALASLVAAFRYPTSSVQPH